MMGADLSARRDIAELRRQVARLEQRAPVAIAQAGRIAAILDATAAEFDVTVEEMLGESTRATVALPRHVAMALAPRLLGYSLTRIGRLMSRDHTTVLHAVRRIAAMAQQNPDFAARIDRIAASVNHQKKGSRA